MPRKPAHKRTIDPGAALFGPTRLAVVIRVFGDPDASFDVPDLARAAAASTRLVQREVNALLRAGLVARKVRDRRVYYGANAQAPACTALCELARALSARDGEAKPRPPVPARVVPDRAPRRRRVTLEQVEHHWVFLALVMDRWGLGHLGRIYRQFDGDFLRAVVLGEVAHHNLSRLAPAVDYDTARIRAALAEPQDKHLLLPCNAFSISQATSVPRETVRRKVDELVAAGLLVRDHKRELYLAPGAERYRPFMKDTHHALNDMIETVDRICARIFGPPPGE